MVSGATAIDILKQDGARVEAYLAQAVARDAEAPEKLREAVEYSLLGGGKRLRAALVLECARACAGDQRAEKSALAAAGAIELVHAFSLVHDDLPAMDDDDLRRGRPTNHKVYGEAMAILAGDAMVTLAFDIIALDADPAVVPGLVRELAHASGPEGMIGGQVLDMQGEGVSLSMEQLRELHRRKTGALLTAACRLGGIAAGAGAEQMGALSAYGAHLGLAFQIVDDILDVTSTPEQMGKATGKDAGKGKNTYPGLLGLEASRRRADEEVAAALAAVQSMGEAAEPLRILARFVTQRHT